MTKDNVRLTPSKTVLDMLESREMTKDNVRHTPSKTSVRVLSWTCRSQGKQPRTLFDTHLQRLSWIYWSQRKWPGTLFDTPSKTTVGRLSWTCWSQGNDQGQCSTRTFKDCCRCTVLDMLESREMTKQIDNVWHTPSKTTVGGLSWTCLSQGKQPRTMFDMHLQRLL